MLSTTQMLGLIVVLLAPIAVLAAETTPEALIFGVFTEKCFDTFFAQFDLFNMGCIKSTISKLLSFAIIAGSFLLKLPQILNIVSNADTSGLSSLSLYMDVASFLPSPIYNYLNGNDFATYGEACVVLVENIIVVLVFWHFSPKEAKPGLEACPSLTTRFGCMVAAVVLAASLFFMPESLWWTQPSIAMGFTITARVPQIMTNFKNGHTGQLAIITWLLNFAGALARVLTTIAEPGISESSRPWLLFSFGTGATLSFIVILQIGMYWKKTQEVLAQAKEEKTK